jgi:protein-tyrosine-phosphatase
VISSSSLHEANEGNEDVWGELSQALEDVGISEPMINEHRGYIVSWLSRALKEGELEERPPQEDPAEQPEQHTQGDDDQPALDSESVEAEGSEGEDTTEEVSTQQHTEALSNYPTQIETRPLVTVQSSDRRASILFIDTKNTGQLSANIVGIHLLTLSVRSALAQAYLECLTERHPALQNFIAMIDSAGVDLDAQPSAHALEGVKLFLAEEGISSHFNHVPRRFRPEDFSNFKYILAMCDYHMPYLEHNTANTYSLATGYKVELLGSFGHKVRWEGDVAEPECIGDREWFEVGGTRIYPGYEQCFRDIKEYMHEFLLDAFGFDVLESVSVQHQSSNRDRRVMASTQIQSM